MTSTLTNLADLIGAVLLCIQFVKGKKSMIAGTMTRVSADLVAEQALLPHVRPAVERFWIAAFGSGLIALSALVRVIWL